MVCVLCVFILEREGRRFAFLLGRPFSSEENKGTLAEVFVISSQVRNMPFSPLEEYSKGSQIVWNWNELRIPCKVF
jgi:hypothetical protein